MFKWLSSRKCNLVSSSIIKRGFASSTKQKDKYDVVVIGGGHAGCEAAYGMKIEIDGGSILSLN